MALGCSSFSLVAQDTLYFDGSDRELTSIEGAEEYGVLLHDSLQKDRAVERRYKMDNTPVSEITYFPFSQKVRNGKSRYWNDQGKIKQEIDYEEGKIHGEVMTWYPNGQMLRHDRFDEHDFVSGTCWDSVGVEIEHFDFMVMPTFRGGDEHLFKYLGENIVYPEKARLRNEQGVVYIQFVVSKTGELSEYRILRGVTEALDNETIRVVSNMPKWEPGLIDGQPASFNFNLPVRYSLRGKKKKTKKKRN